MTQRNISEELNIQQHRCEKKKFNVQIGETISWNGHLQRYLHVFPIHYSNAAYNSRVYPPHNWTNAFR